MNGDSSDEYRRTLVSLLEKPEEHFARAVLTLSGGALAVAFTSVNKLTCAIFERYLHFSERFDSVGEMALTNCNFGVWPSQSQGTNNEVTIKKVSTTLRFPTSNISIRIRLLYIAAWNLFPPGALKNHGVVNESSEPPPS